eukprot:13293-Heterococcus_DN1.PRE.2
MAERIFPGRHVKAMAGKLGIQHCLRTRGQLLRVIPLCVYCTVVAACTLTSSPPYEHIVITTCVNAHTTAAVYGANDLYAVYSTDTIRR